MAVLGPHALALAQEPEAPDAAPTFRAVRMHRRMSSTQNGAETVVWDIVFSTGNSAQERELQELVILADQTCQYVRGSGVRLGSRPWVVWDSGHVGTT